MPSIEQYKMFVAVAESNSLRAAAKSIYKSQPTVTTAIKKMEDELSLSLFNRDEYRLQLTEHGRMIYRTALNLLAHHEEVSDLASHFNKGEESSLKIAIEASFDMSSIISILGRIQQDFSSTQFILQQEYVSGAFELLLNEQVDLAITPIDPMSFSVGEIERKHLYTGHFVNLASPTLLNRHNDLKNVQQLKDEYQIVIRDTGTATGDKQIGVQQGQRTWYVNNFETKLLLIRNGLGWGSMPMNIVKHLLETEELVALNLSDCPDYNNIEYSLIKLKRKILGPIATNLWHMF